MDAKRSHDEHTVIIEIPGITGTSVRKCPACGAYINPRDGKCRSCGKAVAGSDKIGGFAKCPVCDGFLSKKDGSCRTCGYQMDRKEELPDLPPLPSAISTQTSAPPPTAQPAQPAGTKVKCGGCGKILLVTTEQRPIKIKCSNCGSILQLS